MSRDAESSPLGPSRGRRLLRVCLALLAVGLVSLLVGRGFGSPPRIAWAVHLMRGEDGVFDRAPLEEALTDAFLQAQASTLHSNTTSTFSTHDSPAGLPALPMRRLTVFLDGDHPLLHRVAVVVLERLMDRGPFDEITVHPQGEPPAVGGSAPDLFLVLQLPTVLSSGLLREDVQATVRAAVGTNLVSAMLNRPLAEFLPWNNFRMSLEVGYGSRFTGVRTGSMEWQLQGTELGEQVAEALLKTLASPRRALPAMAVLPESLVPEYQPAPEFSFLGEEARTWLSTHGLFTANESVWECPKAADGEAFHAEVIDELVRDGWGWDAEDCEPGVFVTLTKGSRELQVRSDDRADWILYRERSSEEEQARLLTEVLEQSELNESFLVLFNPWWTEDQDAVIREHFGQHPPRTEVAWLYYSRLQQRVGHTEEAIQSLRAAHMLASLRDAFAGLKAPWERHAKKLGLDPDAPLEMDQALLDAVGVVPFTDGNPSHAAAEVGVGGMAIFSWRGEEGEAPILHVVSVTRRGPFFDVRVATGTGVRLGGTTSIGVSLQDPREFHQGRNGVQYKTRLEPLDAGSERYRVLVTRTGP